MSQLLVDICMTATIRHLLLEETLKSFTEKMLKDKSQYRLILNIDPIGEKRKRITAMKEIARKYFDNIIINEPEAPGFTKAVQWCWNNTTAPFVFHLEDDWKLLTEININNMIQILNQNEQLVSLRLNKEKTGKSKHSNQYGFVYSPKISLNPTLFKGVFIRTVAPLMDLNFNPEKQLRPSHSTERGKYILNFQHGIYTRESTNRVVLDIGRKWMDKSKYTKTTGFLKWDVKE